METIILPEKVLNILDQEVIVYCANCDIILYNHEKESVVSNHVANEAMMGHAGDLRHRVIRVKKPERVI